MPPSVRKYPIPNRLNIVVTVLVCCLAVALLVVASRLDSLWQQLVVGVLFSYVMLTDYALLHEAAHDKLHSSPRGNAVLGFVAGVLFPASYTMVRCMHQNHHRRNRTDFEMFDLYYPNDSMVLKYLQWYSILCGLFWPLVPLGSLLYVLVPSRVMTQVFRRANPSRGLHMVNDVRPREMTRIRWETLAIMVALSSLAWFANLRWQPTLLLYGLFAFNWSTRQYVTHAYSKRDIIDGAWNLKHTRLMELILLNSSWHLNHHRYPRISWVHLPSLSEANEVRPSYIAHYWRQWLGPVACAEPEPTLSAADAAKLA